MNNFSAVIPVHNGEKFIEESILSLIDQILPNNIIVVDDGSLDDTQRIVRKFGKIKIINNTFRSGVSSSLNTGAKAVETQYFLIQGADDISLPNRISIQDKHLSNTEATCVIGTPQTINSEGCNIENNAFRNVNPAPKINFIDLFNNSNYLCAPAASFNTQKFLNSGGFNSYLLLLQDYKLWLDLALSNEIEYSAECVVNYRFHGENLSKLHSVFHKTRMLNETESIYRFYLKKFCFNLELARRTFDEKFETEYEVVLYLIKVYLNHPNYFVRILGFKLIAENSMGREFKVDSFGIFDLQPFEYISNNGLQFPDI
jgi:glycosyltransferase involved in cell wall biosynthesis